MLHAFVKAIDAMNDWIGRTVAWLTLGCVLTCFSVVVLPRPQLGRFFPRPFHAAWDSFSGRTHRKESF